VEVGRFKSLVVAGLSVTLLVAPSAQAEAAARPSPCAHPPRTRFTYHWPVKPFNTEHPVRGAFGDPRGEHILQPFGWTGPGQVGSDSFHSGIDIVASPGAPVYPVVSGRVVIRGRNDIIVRTDDGRSFLYDHLARVVHRGQFVVAERTILGRIQARFGHVHLTEVDSRVGHNPLDPGHLEPYHDMTTPTATGLYVDDGPLPSELAGRSLGPHDRLAVAVSDPQPLPVPGPWLGLPQMPALVEWRLFGRIHTSWRIAADFRRTEPPPKDYWNVYGPGTYQNSPVFDHQLFLGTPGRYLVRVNFHPSLPPGLYRLEIRVADVCLNASTATWPLQIAS
jgi:Peptidase family M23